MMNDSIRTVQDTLKSEVQSLRGKAIDMESAILELRVQCNSKVSGEELASVIDKKLQVL